MLTTAGMLTGALVAIGAVLALWTVLFGFLSFDGSIGQLFTLDMFWSLVDALLRYTAFGAGVFIALRLVAPIVGSSSWQLTVRNGIIATIFGALAAFLFGSIVSGIAAVTIGAYPFGYSLDAGIDPLRIQYGIQNVLAGALTPLLEWLPLTVLACVFLKLWLAAHPTIVVTARDRDAVSARS
jgi:hypothetical protein